MNTTNTTKLIDNKNAQTFKSLYGRYIGLLQFIGAKYNVPECEREELIQDCFMKFFESEATFISEEAVKGFLCVSLKNQIIDRARRCKTRKTESVETSGVVGAETALWSSDSDLEYKVSCVSHVIEEVSKNAGEELFGWFYRDGLSTKEIAERSGTALGSVTSKLCRLRAKYRFFIMSYLENNETALSSSSYLQQRA